MAITFDNVDDRIPCGTGNIVTNSTPCTISAWINPNSAGGGGLARIFYKQGSSTSLGMELLLNNATPRGVQYAIDGVTPVYRITSSVITYGNWHHVLVTWDGGTASANIHIYINGTEPSYSSSSEGNTLASLNNGTNMIGNRADLTRTFDGKITELAVWGAILSSTDIATLYNSGSTIKGAPLSVNVANLKAYWPMNDGIIGNTANGANVADASGKGNNGTGNWGANASGLLWSSEIPPFSLVSNLALLLGVGK